MADAYEPVHLLLVAADGHQEGWVREELALAEGIQYQLLTGDSFDGVLKTVEEESCAAVLADATRHPGGVRRLLDVCRYRQSEVPVIALLAAPDPPLELELIAAGAADCVVSGAGAPGSLLRLLRLAMARQRAAATMLQRLHYDPLTGVPNRLLFRDRLNQALERCRRQRGQLALLHIDLDGFKQVNKSFGHDAGDKLVRATAERLGLCVRRIDSLARIGGDEFTVVLEEIRGTADITPVVKKIIDFLSRPFDLDGRQVALGCSIGIAVFPDGGDNLDELLTHADMAMKQAKQERGSQYRFYSAQMQLEAKDRMQLEADLRRALRRNEFELFYQPRVELESGEVVGIEALIRWRHPERGLLSPLEFIPLAEEIGLIMPIGYWTIHQACADLAILDERGFGPLDVAVNLSFKQLQDEAFIDTATRILTQAAVDASRVEFELTETAVMSNFDKTFQGMTALTQLGASFSLDDFGTGYSSFVHLQRLPISALKLDRSFISNVMSSEDDATIVRAMINLAHSLKLNVIAEGAETLSQVQFLWQHHCDQIQGYYFSTPVDLPHLMELLQQRAMAAL